MATLNFQSEFAPLIKSGAKKQTIRAMRNIQRGDTIELNSESKRIGNCVVTNIELIAINDFQLSVNGIYLNNEQAKEFAINDGFNCLDDFINFFKNHYGLPFTGILIKWDRVNHANPIVNRYLSEYLQQITDCEKRKSKLSDWECEFIESLRGQIENNKIPTIKQIETLDAVWDKATARG